MEKINIGTYSFGRDGNMTLLDKLKAAKELGYTGIEFLADDMQYSAEELKGWLDEAGVEAVSLHAAMDLITEETIKKMSDIGGKMIICPGHPFCDKAEAIDLAKLLDEKATLAEPYGIMIGYHNHTSEFYVDEGKPILEYVIENSKKAYFQLDCGWATAAGIDCAAFINKYPGRFCSVHVKENDTVIGPGGKPRSAKDPAPARPRMKNPDEMTEEEKEAFAKMRAQMAERTKIQCKMGDPKSNINWKAIKAAMDAQGIFTQWTVEREGFYDERLTCLKDDAEWIKANL